MSNRCSRLYRTHSAADRNETILEREQCAPQSYEIDQLVCSQEHESEKGTQELQKTRDFPC